MSPISHHQGPQGPSLDSPHDFSVKHNPQMEASIKLIPGGEVAPILYYCLVASSAPNVTRHGPQDSKCYDYTKYDLNAIHDNHYMRIMGLMPVHLLVPIRYYIIHVE